MGVAGFCLNPILAAASGSIGPASGAFVGAGRSHVCLVDNIVVAALMARAENLCSYGPVGVPKIADLNIDIDYTINQYLLLYVGCPPIRSMATQICG